jgi:hypothetical protein
MQLIGLLVSKLQTNKSATRCVEIFINVPAGLPYQTPCYKISQKYKQHRSEMRW